MDEQAAPVRVGVRLLPWRPHRRRWRRDTDVGDLGDLVGGADDLLGGLALLVVGVLLALLAPLLLGVLLLSGEVLALAVVLLVLLLARLVGLLCWDVVVVAADGSTRTERVRGVLALRRRLRALRSGTVPG